MAIGKTFAGNVFNFTGNPPASPQTFNHTVSSGSDRVLAFGFTMRGGGGGVITGVTFNGIAMSGVTTEAVAGSTHSVIYYLVNPPVGTFTVSISHNFVGGGTVTVSALDMTGVDQANPVDAFAKAGATSAGPMTVNITTTVPDCLIFDACTMRTGSGDTASMTAMTNRVQEYNALYATGNSFRNLLSTVLPAASAGTYAMEWTKTYNHDWAIMAVAFKPSAAITGTLTKTLAALTTTSAASLELLASVGKTLTPLTATGSASLELQASLGKTLAPLTAAGVGSVEIQGTVGKTLAPVTVSASGTIAQPGGVVNATLAPVTAAAVGSLDLSGGAIINLAPLTATGAGSLQLTAGLVRTLAPLTAQSAGSLTIAGSANRTLVPLTAAGVGGLDLLATVAKTLAPLTLYAWELITLLDTPPSRSALAVGEKFAGRSISPSVASRSASPLAASLSAGA